MAWKAYVGLANPLDSARAWRDRDYPTAARVVAAKTRVDLAKDCVREDFALAMVVKEVDSPLKIPLLKMIRVKNTAV
jgi:hypothetical protein